MKPPKAEPLSLQVASEPGKLHHLARAHWDRQKKAIGSEPIDDALIADSMAVFAELHTAAQAEEIARLTGERDLYLAGVRKFQDIVTEGDEESKRMEAELARLTLIEENLADYAKRFFRLFDQYRNAWLREMGGVIRPKSWEIDGFVLRMRDIYEKAQLVDRMKQVMVKTLKEKCSADELFDAVFKMLAEDGRDKIPTN